MSTNRSVALRLVTVLALVATGVACGAATPPEEQAFRSVSPAAEEWAEQEKVAGGIGASASSPGFGARSRPAPAPMRGADRNVAREAEATVDDREGGPSGEEDAGRARSWFPESFLWQPLVETGPDGTAVVAFTVPDSLTTWRILALAHDRDGQQTGAVATFDSTLPVYVDPVAPGWLYAGDQLSLPVQVTNHTARAVAGALTLEAEGPLVGLGTASLSLSPGATDVRALSLGASGAGEARLTARFRAGEHEDAAERTVPVLPTGRPVVATAGGTLTDARPLTVPAADGADPSTQELEVVLFGGPLAVVQAELGRLAGGARPMDPAYGFALGARMEALAAAAGVPAPADALRKVRLLSWQRVVREARAADAGVAADLLVSLRGELGVEAAGPVRTSLVRALVDGQRADGTWGRRPSAPLQEVLAHTAWSARALPDDQRSARLRAGAALERFLHEVKDPYTAALVLATGLVDADAAAPLLATLGEGIRRRDDGAPWIEVPAGVVNPWGVPPAPAEGMAAAVLALPDGADRRDLAAALLSGWSAVDGFRAGRADALALEALAAALPTTTAPVTVTVLADGEAIASGRYDPSRPGEPLLLQARPSPGASLSLRAEPPVAGAAFVATRRSYVPWSEADRVAGVDVAVTPGRLVAGQPGAVEVELLAPTGRVVTLELPLPAGTAVDAAAVLAANPGLAPRQVVVRPDRVVLTSARFTAAAAQRWSIPVTPQFGGSFSTAPLLLEVDGRAPVPLRPPRFVVAGPTGS